MKSKNYFLKKKTEKKKFQEINNNENVEVI